MYGIWGSDGSHVGSLDAHAGLPSGGAGPSIWGLGGTVV